MLQRNLRYIPMQIEAEPGQPLPSSQAASMQSGYHQLYRSSEIFDTGGVTYGLNPDNSNRAQKKKKWFLQNSKMGSTGKVSDSTSAAVCSCGLKTRTCLSETQTCTALQDAQHKVFGRILELFFITTSDVQLGPTGKIAAMAEKP